MDRGFLSNLKNLTISTGPTVKAYLAGRRKGIFNPLAYAALTITAFIIFGKMFFPSFTPVEEVVSSSVLEKESSPGYLVGKHIGIYFKYYWLASILLLSFSTSLIFRKYNFFEHITINAFIVGHATIAAIVFMPITRISFLAYLPFTYFAILLLLFRVFREPQKTWISLFKSIAALLIYFLLPFVLVFLWIGIMD